MCVCDAARGWVRTRADGRHTPRGAQRQVRPARGEHWHDHRRWRLARAVGKSRAMELVLTGRMWSAQEAAAWGMASRVVGGGDGEGEGDAAAVVREAVALAGEIAGKSQIAVQAQKEAVNAGTFGVSRFLLPGYTTMMIHFYVSVSLSLVL